MYAAWPDQLTRSAKPTAYPTPPRLSTRARKNRRLLHFRDDRYSVKRPFAQAQIDAIQCACFAIPQPPYIWRVLARQEAIPAS
ncbi:hypothetical protein GGD41_004956 [Paraburkholderia bryophila]|uniref:Uncharacterized protein n=1 Tax=Paraburkholderia bryophila TaxID=420952 RepID=A0A7Y9WCJ3_9BURK|nr:hypothetical protein [Paraburkholderia bryophila]